MEKASAHPSQEELSAFGLGKLDEERARTIARHLAGCGACCDRVENVPSDTFVRLLQRREQLAPGPRAAQAADAGPAGTSVPESARGDTRPDAELGPGLPLTATDVPAGLADHPRYRIVRLLGKGGMGAVYLAEHVVMCQPRALKVIAPEFVANPQAVERFRREIQTAARLDHVNIVRAYDAEQSGQTHFLVMEYVEGTDLASLLKKKGPLPVAHACHFVRQAALGLEHAREHGMVHRDIKPHNLMLARKNVVKILDFGLAKVVSEAGEEAGSPTRDGAMMGTPDYMAPEQWRDARTADIRADTYSLGCTLYALLTGAPPFHDATGPMQKMTAHVQQKPRPLNEARPEVPAELSALVDRMLAKSAADRPQTPGQVAQTLASFIKTKDIPVVARQTRAKGLASTDVWKSPAKPAPSLPAAEAATWRRRAPNFGVLVGVLLAGLAATAVAGIVVYWPTPRGVVKIESDDPDVAIVFDKTGPALKAAGKEPIELGVGEHGVLLKRGDIEFESDKFLIRKGETIKLRVELLKDRVQVSAHGQVIGEKRLPQAAGVNASPDGTLPKTFTNKIGMEFVLVPKGKSWLGGGGGKPGDSPVAISQDFYLGKYDVTQEQWERITGSNPSHFSRTGAGKDAVRDIPERELNRFPVEFVSWHDAQLFLKLLNTQEREEAWVYRLPKEAEWEYSCRGGPLADPFDSAFDFYCQRPKTHCKRRTRISTSPGHKT